MTGTMKLWTLASCLLAIAVTSDAQNFGRSPSKPLLCAGEPVRLEKINTIAKECNFKFKIGRKVGKECPSACVQHAVGILDDNYDLITDKETLVKNLIKSGIYPEHASRVTVEHALKSNCNEKIAKSKECADHLNFGDCLIEATLVSCGLTREQAEAYKDEVPHEK